MPPIKTKTRERPGEQRRVSSPVGVRIRAARTKAGLTQQQLAGDRYTKAYISALENGLVRPSVAALEYLAPRLGSSASGLLADSLPAWSRMDVDLQLATANWQTAADGYRDLLAAGTPDKGTRAELLRGQAEADARLGNASDAVAAASEAVEIFNSLGQPEDSALASYWLSAGLYGQDNTSDAKAVLQEILAKIRLGLRVEPDFKLRVLMALSSNESRDGNHEAALSYLSEVRALEDTLDDRRRAAFLFDLSYSYCETGDYEAAIRTGHRALGLFKTIDTVNGIARLENEMALAYLGTGNVERAAELANSSMTRFVALDDQRQRAHVLDTQAQIALARNDFGEAARLATESLELARTTDNSPAKSDALLTSARATAGIARKSGNKDQLDAADKAFQSAVADARASGRQQTIKNALTEYAEFLAANGDHKQAFELTREALATSR